MVEHAVAAEHARVQPQLALLDQAQDGDGRDELRQAEHRHGGARVSGGVADVAPGAGVQRPAAIRDGDGCGVKLVLVGEVDEGVGEALWQSGRVPGCQHGETWAYL